MKWLLDTSVCIPLMNGADERAAQRLLGRSPATVCLCSVVKAELYYGAHNSSRVAENLQRVEIFCRAFESLPFDDAASERYGVIRAQLRREGRLIGANDLMIAAIALDRGLTVATRNQDEFGRVPGLDVEAW